MTGAEQRQAAKKFAEHWTGRGYEKGESQIFWIELLTSVYGVTDISSFIFFEDQVKRYSAELPYSKRPRWIVTCNFQCFHVYDMEQPGGEPEVINLEDLEKEYYRLQFLVDLGNEHLQKEMEVSIKAGILFVCRGCRYLWA